MATENKKTEQSVYHATAGSLNELFGKFSYYPALLAEFREGKTTAELRKRFMLKAIDEAWVSAVEDALPSLDTVIRHPGMLLKEEEQLLSVEETRHITSRSVEHLCRHTDLINDIKQDGTVVPSKLLNVFQDETMLTYENKFINTLLSHLYAFVSKRYENASACGEDEKNTSFTLTQEFEEGETHGKISVQVEVSEHPKDGEVLKNYIYTTDLWRRVERLYKIICSYMDSDFVQKMGRNYVHPPILRTNKILKNPDFRQCLALWEFLGQYDNTGYQTMIEEDLEDVSEECLSDFYRSVGAQYVLFRNHIQNEFDPANILDKQKTEQPIRPKMVQELSPLAEKDFAVTEEIPGEKENFTTEEEEELAEAVLVALDADLRLLETEKKKEEEAQQKQLAFRYKFSFLARYIFAGNPLQDFYTAIKNELLSYKKVKSRISWNHETFNAGRLKCARVNVKGKTLFLYLPLNPADYPENKYHQTDVSEKSADLPFLLKIRSERSAKHALELIADVMRVLGLAKAENPTYADYHMDYATPEELAHRDPPLVKIIGEELAEGEKLPFSEVFTKGEEDAEELPLEGENAENKPAFRYKFSFESRLIFAGDPLQNFYTLLKNELLSYREIKARTSWNHEAFHAGRMKCARINVKGKTLFLYLPLNPADYPESKFHQIDVSEKLPELPLLLKVKSERGANHAVELIAAMAALCGLEKSENYEYQDYHRPYATPEELAHRDPPLVKIIEEANAAEETAEVAAVPAEETAVAEETAMEETAAEETAAEEMAEVTATPAEETAETAITEETVAEESASEESAEGTEISAEETEPAAPQAEDTADEVDAVLYDFSFLAHLITAGEPFTEYYTDIKNQLFALDGMTSRISWNEETFAAADVNYARISWGEECLYLALPYALSDYPQEVYHQTDAAFQDAALPFLVKINGESSLRLALALIDNLPLRKSNDFVPQDYAVDFATPEEMAKFDPPLVRILSVEGKFATEEPEKAISTPAKRANDEAKSVILPAKAVVTEKTAPVYDFSFLARLITAGEPIEEYYSDVKNKLFSLGDMHAQITWENETFAANGVNYARVDVKEECLCLYLPYALSDYPQSVYHQTDAAREDAALPFLMKISGESSLRLALDLIDALPLERNGIHTEQDYRPDFATPEEMAEFDPPLVKILNGEEKPDKVAEATDSATEPAIDEPIIPAEPTAKTAVAEAPIAEETAEKEAESKPETEEENSPVAAETAEIPGTEITAEAEVEEKESAVVESADGTYSRYRFSYWAHMIQAPDELKDAYNEIKNCLLSYDRVTDTMAWGHENFRRGRNSCARLKVRGKSLLLFLALNPADVEEKYHTEDLGDKDKDGMPTLLRVRSDRSVKYAKALIEQMMEAAEAVKLENSYTDYRPAYQTTEELLNSDEPLIRVSEEKRFF